MLIYDWEGWKYLRCSNGCICVISKAVTMFENDERFKAVERARDREDLYESYIVELERKVIIFTFIFHFRLVVDIIS